MSLKLPTPPTPPTIDKGEAADFQPKIDAHKVFGIPFQRDSKSVAQEPAAKISQENPSAVNRKVTTPETMARDAVANGAGALTKKIVTRPENPTAEIPRPSQSQLQQNLSVVNNDPNRGKSVLREFQNEDRQFNTQTSKETPRSIKVNQHEGYGGIFWLVTLIVAVAAGFTFVRKFLLTDKPKLKKSDLFEGSSERLKSTAEKVSAPIKKSPSRKDDDKGKHFEVRV